MMSLRKAKQTIRANVERGAALLDKRHPRWFEQIDLAAFDLSSGQYCICGQLDAVHRKSGLGSGDWQNAVRRLFGRQINYSKPNSRDETHGFAVPWELTDVFLAHDQSGWHYAEGIWKTEIRKRLRAKKAAEKELLAA